MDQAIGSDNTVYFGNPVYTYFLKRGIEDREVDNEGLLLEKKTYTQNDFSRKIIVEDRGKLVVQRLTDFIKANDNRDAKTLILKWLDSIFSPFLILKS